MFDLIQARTILMIVLARMEDHDLFVTSIRSRVFAASQRGSEITIELLACPLQLVIWNDEGQITLKVSLETWTAGLQLRSRDLPKQEEDLLRKIWFCAWAQEQQKVFDHRGKCRELFALMESFPDATTLLYQQQKI